MQNNYDRIEYLLKQACTNHVTQAQKELQSILKSDPLAFTHLHNIIRNTKQEWVKMIAVSYCNTSFCDNLFCLSDQEANNHLINILEDKNINAKYKRIFQRSIINLIDKLNQPYLTQLRELIHLFMQQQELRDTAYLLIGCFSVPDIDINHLIYLTTLYLEPTLNRMVLFDQSAKIIDMAYEYDQILKTWIVVWNKLAEYAVVPGPNQPSGQIYKNKKQYNVAAANILANMADNQSICRCILQIYNWLGNQGIYFCGQKQLTQLNMIKSNAAELHWKCLQFIITHSIPQMTKIQKFTQQILDTLLKNMYLFANQRKKIQQYRSKQFATGIVKIIRLYVQFNPSYFATEWRSMLVYFVIPLLQINDDQMEQFEEEKEDFIALFQDCSEAQKFQNVKSEAAKLLQTIGENGIKISQKEFILEFIISYGIDSIANSFGVTTKRSQFYENQGIRYTTFECSMQLLSVMSFALKQYQGNLLSQLKNLLTKERVINLSPLDRSRLYSYMGYNFSQTFPNLSDGNFILDLALQDQGHPTVTYSAIDFFSNIADEYYSDLFIEGLCNKIMGNKNAVLWQTISKLIKHHTKKINYQVLIKLVYIIIKKIDKEIEQYENNQINHSQHMIKLIQIIQIIASIMNQSGQYVNNAYNNFQLKNTVWQAVKFLIPFSKYQIEDEVLRIINTFLKNEEKLIDNHPYYGIVNDILFCFKKNKYHDQIYYRILNSYLMKSAYNQTIRQIISFFYSAMMGLLVSKEVKRNQLKIRIIFANILILLQNGIALFGTYLPKQQMHEISCIPMRFMPGYTNNNTKQEQIYDKILLGRAINLLILCHFCDKVDEIWNYVLKYYEKEIFYGYDLKVLIVCIRKQIGRLNNLQEIGALISIIVRCIDLYNKRRIMEIKAQKIRQSKGKSLNKNMSRIKINKDHQYSKLVKTIMTPFTIQSIRINNEKQLKDLLNELKLKNAQAYNFLINQHISKEDRQKMQIMANGVVLENGQTRKIYSIKGVKHAQDDSKIQNDQLNKQKDEQIFEDSQKFEMKDSQMNSSEQEISEFKRKRVETKKKKKTKKIKNQSFEMHEQ